MPPEHHKLEHLVASYFRSLERFCDSVGTASTETVNDLLKLALPEEFHGRLGRPLTSERRLWLLEQLGKAGSEVHALNQSLRDADLLDSPRSIVAMQRRAFREFQDSEKRLKEHVDEEEPLSPENTSFPPRSDYTDSDTDD